MGAIYKTTKEGRTWEAEFDLQTPTEQKAVACISNPSTPRVTGEVETTESPEGQGPGGPGGTRWCTAKKRSCLTKGGKAMTCS